MVGAGHPGLRAEIFEHCVERGAALRIELGGDLVEKDERRRAREAGDEARMGENEAEQQGLLLAGRAQAGGHLLWPVDDDEVRGVRTFGGASGGAVTAAATGQNAVLDVFHVEPLPADHAFWAHPGITVLPHTAAQTDPRSAAAIAARNVRALRAGEPLAALVDRTKGY